MMKDMGIVQGSTEQAVPLIVGKDRVDVHTGITPVTHDSEGNPVDGLWEYQEIQYDLHEYLNLFVNQTKADIDYISIMTGVEI
jgi:hypothetical protein